MVIGGTHESIGDNLNFNIATASDITLYFNGGSTNAKTSADNTATEKYTDNLSRQKSFALRTNKTIQILGFNGDTLTDPLSVIVNGYPHTEKWDTALLSSIKIRVITDDTNINCRVR